jgi:hypothetical protein
MKMEEEEEGRKGDEEVMKILHYRLAKTIEQNLISSILVLRRSGRVGK